MGEWAFYLSGSRQKGKWIANFSEISRSFSSRKYDGPFKVTPENKEVYKPISTNVASFEGTYKSKFTKKKDMHPGANYHNASNISNQTVREGLRKWNIFWVRLNRNKEMPDGTKEKIKEPKFDRKETDIWNE